MLVPVPVFCCLFVSEKLFWKVSRNALKNYVIYFQVKTKTEPEGHPEGRLPASILPPGAAPPLAAPVAQLAPSGISSSSLFAYKLVFAPKILSTQSYFPEDVRGRRHLQP